MREDDRAQPQILLHIACQAGGQILAAPPTRYLCGALSASCSPASHPATAQMAQACARSALRSTTPAG